MRWAAIVAAGSVWALTAGPPAARADDVGDLGTFDRGVYEATGRVAPRHPVTGRPVLNVVPEALEVKLARDFYRDFAREAAARGTAIDPGGRRLERVRRVFARLVSVSHRRSLPWEVHLVDDPSANAFTPGGGLVVVLGGLWEDMLAEDEEESLAVVLAHEIAHVTMLHPPQRVTWLGVGGRIGSDPNDPYYRAAYTHEQEAEADRLSTLYLALAGYDPLAASRLWARVAASDDDSPARAGFLHDHPMSGERVAITREAAHAVARYHRSGRRHPRADAILADNVLYPRVTDDGYRPGDGFVRAAQAVLEAFGVHRRAARSGEERRASAGDQARVRVVGTWPDPMPNGDPGLAVEVWNGGSRPVRALRFTLAYWSRGAMIFLDDCEHAVAIAPGSARPVTCPRQGVENDRIEPRISEVVW